MEKDDLKVRHWVLDQLSGKPLSLNDICAGWEIPPQICANYIQKTTLDLCSRRQGQGKRRDFCLIDGYALGLFHKIARAYKDLAAVASAINGLLYNQVEIDLLEGKAPFRSKLDAKNLFCQDIYNADNWWTHRDTDRPIYLFGDIDSGFTIGTKPVLSPLHGTWCLNLTFNLTNFDYFVASGRGLKMDPALLLESWPKDRK